MIDPESRTVSVHGKGAEPTAVGAAEVLTGGDLLPDFALPVAELFE